MASRLCFRHCLLLSLLLLGMPADLDGAPAVASIPPCCCFRDTLQLCCCMVSLYCHLWRTSLLPLLLLLAVSKLLQACFLTLARLLSLSFLPVAGASAIVYTVQKCTSLSATIPANSADIGVPGFLLLQEPLLSCTVYILFCY